MGRSQAIEILRQPFIGDWNDSEFWVKGLAHSQAPGCTRQVLDGAESDGSIGLESVRAAMLGIEGQYFYWEGPDGSLHTGAFAGGGRDPELRVHAVLTLWDSIGGLAFSCAALEASTRWRLTCSPAGPRDEQGMWLVSCVPRDPGMQWPEPWLQLRARVATASARERATVETWIEDQRPRLSPGERARLSFVFPERQDWAEADAREAPKGAPWLGYWILPDLRQSGLAKEIALMTRPEPRVVYTMMASLGLDAFDAVTLMPAPLGRADQRTLVEAITHFETPEAVAFLMNFMGQAANAGRVARYLERVPEWSLPALALAAQAGSTSAKRMYDALTRHLVPESAPQTHVVEATNRGLPAVLLNPYPEVLRHAEPAPGVATHFPSKEAHIVPLDIVRDPGSGYAWAAWRGKPEEVASQIRQAALEPERKQVMEPRTLAFLPRDEALTLWNTLPPTFWRIDRPEAFDGLIDRFEHAAVGPMLECLPLSHAPTLTALQGVFTPQLAASVASLLVSSATARPLALEWLARFASGATLALIPDLVGRRGAKERANAAAAISSLKWFAHTEEVDAAFNLQTAAVKAMALDSLSADPFLNRAPQSRMLATFWTPRDWPALKTNDGRVLAERWVDNLGRILRTAPLGLPSPAISSVKSALTSESLSAFGSAVFHSWLAVGLPKDQVWALHAIGHLCGDEMVDEMVRHVHEWPVNGRPGYALTGLAVLAQIGTQEALLAIHRVSQRFKSKGLKDRAGRVLFEAAAARGMSRDELADRLVPDFGLDHRGRRTLSFGARQFQIGLTSKLLPLVMSEDGVHLKALPPARKDDDDTAAEEAHALWKRVKREARAVLTHERHRLEAAMLSERRWSIVDFERYLIRHPLLGAIARTLVWSAHSPRSGDVDLFRVSDSEGAIDVNSEPVHFDGAWSIGLPHPVNLADEERRAWRTHFQARSLSQAFAQLERPVHLLAADAAGAFTLKAYENVEVQSARVLGLETRGWRRSGEQSGSWAAMVRQIPNARSQAEFTLTPGIFAMISEFPAQTLGPVMIGPRQRDSWGTPSEPLPLGAISQIAYSEIVLDLSWLTEGRVSSIV